MNQASLYQRANNVQRHDAKQIMDEYARVFRWRLDGQDALIDVGCGSGNVLMDFVHPILPKNYAQLVGTDISDKMIGYAMKLYRDYERTAFRVLDIGCDQLPNELCEQFDHVTSFYCLHWVQNQRQALRNIYGLLRREGGDCLLVFLASNPTFDVYKVLAKHPKWSSYMKDVDQFISPLHYSSEPRTEFSKILSEVGFVDCKVDVRDEVFIYEGLQNVKDNVKAICPFLERIPANEHAEFLNDFIAVVISMNLREESSDPGAERFIAPYKLVVAYARKIGGFTGIVQKSDERDIERRLN